MDDDNGNVVQDRFHAGAACTLPWCSRQRQINTRMNRELLLEATATRELQTLAPTPTRLNAGSGIMFQMSYARGDAKAERSRIHVWAPWPRA